MKTKRTFACLILALGFSLIYGGNTLELFAVSEAQAATFTVNDTGDASDDNPSDGLCRTATGTCTLRAAVEQANVLQDGATDQINVPAGTYALQQGPLRITDNLDLNGAGASLTVIDGSARNDRIFFVGTSGVKPTVNISGVTIAHGTAPDSTSPGGGIYNFSGVLSLVKTIVINNTANIRGGGIANGNMLRLLQSTVQDNKITQGSAGGGVTDTGGGIFNFSDGIVQIVGSTISGNEATRGGGIFNAVRGSLSVTNSTISGNKARTKGGGILNGGRAEISFSTITSNQSFATIDGVRGSGEHIGGGGIYNGRAPCDTYPGCGRISMGTTILAGNIDNNAQDLSPDCFSTAGTQTFVSLGGNLVGIINSNCNIAHERTGDTQFDLVGTPASPRNPRLGILIDNGGSTNTHALLTSPLSAAIDAGTAVPLVDGQPVRDFFACPDRDQRSFTRQVDGNGDGVGACDIGAYERGGTANTAPWPIPAWPMLPPAPVKNLTVQ